MARKTAKKTEGVRVLVAEILQNMGLPYSHDITERVFLAIEAEAIPLKKYRQLEMELTHDVVNNWIGVYTKEITGMHSIREVKAYRSKLTTSYTELG